MAWTGEALSAWQVKGAAEERLDLDHKSLG
jgi:hypothetical protein